MTDLKDKIEWTTIQTPGEEPISIYAKLVVMSSTLVRPGETEATARERLIMQLRQGLLELTTGIKLQSPSGLQ